MNKERKCYQRLNGRTNLCGKKINLCCSNLKCHVGICNRCSNEFSNNRVVYIESPSDLDSDLENSSSRDNDGISQSDSSSEEINDYEYSVDIAEGNQNTNEYDDFDIHEFTNDEETSDNVNGEYIINGIDEIPNGMDEPELFPTTLAGDNPFIIEEDCQIGKQYVSGHVIMNQCGSLFNHIER